MSEAWPMPSARFEAWSFKRPNPIGMPVSLACPDAVTLTNWMLPWTPVYGQARALRPGHQLRGAIHGTARPTPSR